VTFVEISAIRTGLLKYNLTLLKNVMQKSARVAEISTNVIGFGYFLRLPADPVLSANVSVFYIVLVVCDVNVKVNLLHAAFCAITCDVSTYCCCCWLCAVYVQCFSKQLFTVNYFVMNCFHWNTM